MTRRLVPFALLAATLMATSVASADGPRQHRPPIRRSLISAHLEDASGGRLQTFYHRGQTFVLGQHGQRYAIVVNNHSGRRVEVVIGVDGREAVSGRVTNAATQRGYVIPAYGSVRVQGFRQSMSSVASFRFTDPENSYSSRMGTPHRNGTITVAAFPERTPLLDRPLTVPEREHSRRGYHGPPAGKRSTATDEAGPAPSAEPRATTQGYAERGRICCFPPPRPRNNLGTEYGESRTSRVVEVSFEREHPTRPSQYVTIRYDDVAGLASRGIEVHPRPRPRPLPISVYPSPRYAPPPPPRHRPYLGWD